MNTLEIKFQIITPLFLGGSDQQADGIRPSSIKGALRFWWRALNWARCLQQRDGDEVQALRHLHAEEARLFGIAASENGGGQGVFLMQVVESKISTVEKPFQPLNAGVLYLLGQGMASFKGGNHCLRNGVQKGGTFTVKLIFRPGTCTNDASQVRNAVKALELLGALGSRARHGMGSIASVAPMSRAEYVKAVQELLQPTLYAPAEPPFTAFSRLSRIDISARHDKDALILLDSVGREQQLYRSFGNNGSVSGIPAERNFTDDHDLILDAINGKHPSKAPARTVFGLPHNYFFSNAKGKADVNYAPDGKEARRSSPLLLHIHPVSNGGFVAVHTLMPAKFLPAGGTIRIVPERNKIKGKPSQANHSIQWDVLGNYLNRFIPKGAEVIHGNQ